MDMVKIDALLMDHALGGTSEEVGALVEAYVERDAEARARLEELRGTVGLAKRAMASEPVVLPTFPRTAIERSVQRAVWRRRLIAGVGMAACVAFGVLMGNFWGARNGEPTVAQRGQDEIAPRLASAAPAEMATVRDFWSMARLRASAEQASKENSAEVAWSDRAPLRHSFGGGL